LKTGKYNTHYYYDYYFLVAIVVVDLWVTMKWLSTNPQPGINQKLVFHFIAALGTMEL